MTTETKILEEIIHNVGSDVAGDWIVGKHYDLYLAEQLDAMNAIDSIRSALLSNHMSKLLVEMASTVDKAIDPVSLDKLRELLGL